MSEDATELWERYDRYAALRQRFQSEALHSVPLPKLRECALRLGLPVDEEAAQIAESDMAFAYDLAVHTGPEGRSRAIDRVARRHQRAEGEAARADSVLRDDLRDARCVLVFDDAHEAIPEVVDLLRFLKDAIADSKEARGIILSRRAAAFYDRRDVAIRHRVREIDLGGLDRDEIAALLPLTPEERRVIELHPEYGHEMVRGIGFLGEARSAILHHHERLDGSGYPYGLAGRQIPEFARLQRQILDGACTSLRTGGILVYSVCTTEPEEGAAVIDAFLEEHADFAPDPIPWPAQLQLNVQPAALLLPHRHGTDGFFIARFRRISPGVPGNSPGEFLGWGTGAVA